MPTNPAIGMSVPGASSLMDQASPAAGVAGETAEQKKKRLQAMQQSKQLPVGMSSLADGYGSAMTMQ